MKYKNLKELVRYCDGAGIPILRYFDHAIVQQAAIDVDIEDRIMKDMEKEWFFDMQQHLLEWVRGQENTDFAKNARKRYIKAQQEELFERYKTSSDKIQIEKEIKRLERVLDGKCVSESDIAHARLHPIEKIVKINNRGYALCINHSDSNPSMYCKKNYAHCFSCGYTADVIQLHRDIHNVSFIEAVKSLK